MLYRIAINLYYAAIKTASLFNSKAKKWVSGRKTVFQELENFDFKGKKIVWFHASSYGEFEQGRPLIEEFRKRNPDNAILLTFFSPSGFESFENYEGADFVCYLPFDFRANVKKFLNIVQPSKVFFIKYEFWMNYLKELKKREIPTFLVSAVFRKNQLFFKWYGAWYAKILFAFSNIFVQNQESVNLLENLGIKNVINSGDTRMDRVIAIAKKARSFSLIEKFTEKNKVIIAGSTWEKEDEIIARYINETKMSLKFIVAPHEINENRIEKFIKSLEKKAVRYSLANEEIILEADVLIIDSIGILSAIYRYGHLAFIGGGFADGIHNILEPAVYGLPIIFGPNYNKFTEANDLLELGSAFSIKSYSEFCAISNDLFSDEEKLFLTSVKSSDYVYGSAGATGKVLDKVG